MMKNFNVLDRELSLHQHYLLEASAGTGKTFSIQNIVVRLLIETSSQRPEPLTLDKILVVTFTRAATRDLRLRIRANIDQCLQYLNEWLKEGTVAEEAPDYLVACLENGEEFAKQTKKRLQQALFVFDGAQIFTIHSFCARMLKQNVLAGDLNFSSNTGEEPLSQSEILLVIRDFFRTEIREETYSPGQLAIILKEDPEQKKILRALLSGHEILEVPTFAELYQKFKTVMKNIKEYFHLESANMIADFEAQSGSYKNYKSTETKAETLAKIHRFCDLFNQSEWGIEAFDLLIEDSVVWPLALNPSLLKARAKPPEKLHYPSLTTHLNDTLFPIIYSASHFPFLLARLAKDCQRLVKRYQKEEEKISPDDLLKKMNQALEQEDFKNKVRSKYEAAVIDEFQDTDPVQWMIFRRLFLEEKSSWIGNLYLVGDPKQSIYSFRQADIYTYLSAAQLLGKQRCFSLDTNYRSQPALVTALNTLFTADHLADFISLPKQGNQLPYHQVQFSEHISNKDFNDEKEALHFFIGDGSVFKRAKLADLESEFFFPFIAKEIENLNQKEAIDFHQFAILVRDRHQALRLAEFLGKRNIPYVNQRGTSLANSTALISLIHIIQAVLHPRDLGLVKAALGSTLIGWTHTHLTQPYPLDQILLSFYHLRRILFDSGFAPFYQTFLYTSWNTDKRTVIETLLSQEEGIEIYHDLQQIADLIIDHHYKEWSGPEGLIAFLDQFKLWQSNEDERVKRFQDPAKNGVKILSLHFSKGLEFDIVFALGLVNRTWVQDELIPIEKEGRIILTPKLEEDVEQARYFEEIDAEKMRQLYVAMTRAKYRLYVPVALHLSSQSLLIGEASPIELFLARLNQPSVSLKTLYERIKNYDGSALLSFLDSIGKNNSISYTFCEHIAQTEMIESKRKSKNSFVKPYAVNIPGESSTIVSFSSLARPLIRDYEEGIQDSAIPHDFKNPLKNIHTLPSNFETGLIIHRLLEKISFKDFKSISQEQAIDLIGPFLQKTAYSDWIEPITELIYQALKQPLFEDDVFCLADLDTTNMYKEIDFIFACKTPVQIEEVEIANGYVKGVIDLIFSYKGKYYIIDWKSNWLGSNIENYEQDYLHQAMHEHDYFLQAGLYTEALKRYLNIVEESSFHEIFGGTIYVFLRGIQQQKRSGIYHYLPV